MAVQSPNIYAWNCQDETAKNCKIKYSQGVPCRTVHGWHREKCRSDGNLEYHRWCEYQNKDGKWIVKEQRKFYHHGNGFESWEFGCYVVSRVCDYDGTPCEKFCLNNIN